MALGIVCSVRDAMACTQAFLESIALYTSQPYQVFLVDNGCSDETIPWAEGFCRARGLALRIVPCPGDNLSRAWNRGIQEAMACGCDYIAVVNNDTVVSPGWWDASQQHFQADGHIGCACPIALAPRVGSAIETLRARHCDFPRATPTPDQILGCFMMFRTQVLQEIGLFDERFRIWFGDTDMARRLTAAGYPPVVLANVAIIHDGGRTCGLLGPRLRPLIKEDQQQWQEKYPAP